MFWPSAKNINPLAVVWPMAVASAGLVEDEELWLLMLNDINSTTHIYSEKLVIKI